MSSLNAAPPAKLGDKLVTMGSSVGGFAAAGKPDTRASLLPGTELAFDKDVKYYRRFSLLRILQRLQIGEVPAVQCRQRR